jgi:isoquinoline 1-oxidoreductase alpha subunit
MATFFVNKERVDIAASVPGDTPLLWILRDNLNLTGTKYGCGMALCGACTVLIDGQALRSCVLPVDQAVGKKITTIEGIGAMPVGAALQGAWQEINVPQCGYCQAGQIMSAAALLQAKPKPSDADIDAAMSGNICRCGTYTRIRAAIKRGQEPGLERIHHALAAHACPRPGAVRRRAAFFATAATGAGLTLGLYFGEAISQAPQSASPALPQPAASRIGTDNTVTVMVKHPRWARARSPAADAGRRGAGRARGRKCARKVRRPTPSSTTTRAWPDAGTGGPTATANCSCNTGRSAPRRGRCWPPPLRSSGACRPTRSR